MSCRWALMLAVPLSLGGCTSAKSVTSGLTPANDVVANGPQLKVADPAKVPSSIADLVDRVSPTVVNITTVHVVSGHGDRGPFDFFREQPRRSPRRRTGAGTGFLIDSAGYLITNAHVVHHADQVKVRLRDDRQFDAEVVGRDRKLDIALLRIKDAPKGLPSVVLGSSAKLRVGESVVAVGNPYGLGHTVTMGIVSAKERSIGAGPYDAFIQTDASINPGNSGGPLFNLRGEVVGINTAIRAGADGIGFAIPVDSLKDIVAQLKNKGFVDRGKLGIRFQPVTPEMAAALGLDRPRGAMVSQVYPGTAAAKAGIQAGDVIIAIGDKTIRRSEELPRQVARHAPGKAIAVHILRRGKKIQVTAKLDKLERDDSRKPAPASNSATPEGGKRLGLAVKDTPSGDGVMVIGIGRPIRGLRKGDVIVGVDFKKVTTIESLKKAISARKPGSSVLLRVRRGGEHSYVGVRLVR